MKISILEWGTVTNGDIPSDIFNRLGEVRCYHNTSASSVVNHIGDSEIVLCNKCLITEEIMEQCPNIQYIGLCATGYNNIDIKAASKRGITVCNAGGYSTNAVAQLVFAYILNQCSKVSRYNDIVQEGQWIKSDTFSLFPIPTTEVAGKTLGIIGYGNIGKKVACIADAFKMNVIIATRTKPENCKFKLVSIDEAFSLSDFLTIHCPLTPETEKLVNKSRLSKMKPSAMLINTSRGGVVDEQALSDALNSSSIAAAAVDVLEYEPMREDTPLRNAKNCVITPHMAWSPFETRRRLVHIVYENIAAFLSGKPINKVN